MVNKVIRGSCQDFGCWVGELLKGCKLCMDGLKTVVFVTGICPEKCFYCPLSKWRKNSDVIYVNEVKVEDLNDIIIESLISGSEGAGITGGDPLAKFERTLTIIRSLKEFFGAKYHIHLYTSGMLLNKNRLEKLVKAGLDELRIHITGQHSWRALELAKDADLTVAIENPVLPGSDDFLKNLVMKAVKLGIRFINLNELEFSETNYESLIMRGYKPSIKYGIAAEGSRETAINLLDWVIEEGLNISIHFCPALYKDKYQFRKRMWRRGLRTKQFYEELRDGIVRWAEIHGCPEKRRYNELLSLGLGVLRNGRLIVNPSIARSLGCRGYIIEAYPTTPRKELNKYPLK